MLVLAAGFLAVGPPAGVAEAAGVQAEADCRDWCAEKAAEKCDDVTSTWCNVYITGCLAGCGWSHL
jgi:hypothetical protein